jgi:co-chaperonin GroES (HSP10)
MDHDQAKTIIGKPATARLKALGRGVTVRRVLGTRLLVRVLQSETEMDAVEKQGLLYIPEQIKKDNTPLPYMGVVVQLGEELQGSAPEVDDVVLFSKFSGTDVRLNEQDFRIVEVNEVIAVLDVAEGVEFQETVLREDQVLGA